MSDKEKQNENNPKYDIIIFTYRGDSVTIVPCIKSCIHTLGNDIGTILVVDDGYAAMAKKDREIVEGLPNVKYIQSTWERNGNLIGRAHQQGYLHLVQKCIEDGTFKGKVLIKIDPDTSLWKRDFLDEFYDDDEYLVVSSFKSQNLLTFYCMGNMYAYKLDKEVIDLACKDVDEYPDFFNAFEDYCLTVRIARAAKTLGKYKLMISRWNSGGVDGFLLVNPEHPVDVNYIKGFSVRNEKGEVVRVEPGKCRVFCNGFGINQKNKEMQARVQVLLYKYMTGEYQDVLKENYLYNPVNNSLSPMQGAQMAMPVHPQAKTGNVVNPVSGQVISSNAPQLKMDPSTLANMNLVNPFPTKSK